MNPSNPPLPVVLAVTVVDKMDHSERANLDMLLNLDRRIKKASAGQSLKMVEEEQSIGAGADNYIHALSGVGSTSELQGQTSVFDSEG